ncbi:MAG TPA: gamma-glutamyltransferase [Thermoanaerobaculia bacterium]|nr:gamma-glutamyltransferase [Thermoanaerobaculia bacterium]
MTRWFPALLLAVAPALATAQVVAERAALSTASPAATKIGLSVLASGGNAIDAAVAVSFALAVSHPQAGNIGGGGFLVYYDAADDAVWTLDYREVAPARATRQMYLDAEGKPRKNASTVGPLATAVPGAVAGLAEMHERFGSMGWRELVEPAVRLARDGFVWRNIDVLHLAEAQKLREIDRFPATAELLFPGGSALETGALVRQPRLARTLDRIARHGAREFYEGATSRMILDAMRSEGGIISARDLREYRPVWRAPIRIDDRDHQIYTMAPPSAGGLLLGEMLQILEPYDLQSFGFQSAGYVHLLAEIERRAFLDRNRFIGDPAATRIPYAMLFSAERAATWRRSIDLHRASSTRALTDTAVTPAPAGETTHFSIVDPHGNIASITTTLNTFFGSGYLVPEGGFFLNNEMDDFTSAPGQPNAYGLVQGDANAIEPGRKMASSMSPTIVFRGGEPLLVLGSPGGGAIPTIVLQVFLNVTEFGMSLVEAVEAPRYHHQAWPDEISWERDRTDLEFVTTLNRMGHATRQVDSIGDVHALMFRDGKIHAVADTRREGLAGGF